MDPAAAARDLLDRASAAMPATEEQVHHGWRLRATDTASWWVGSVLPHRPSAAGPSDRALPCPEPSDAEPWGAAVLAAERYYAARGTVPRFQMCPGCPPELDAVLAGRGYRAHTPMSLQVADAAEVAAGRPSPALGVRLSDHPDAPWFAAWGAVHAPDVDPEPEWRLLHRTRRPSAYAAVLESASVVAVGRAVADGAWAGVFGMATLPHARGRGAARTVLRALALWATDRGATRLYLQLERDNVPAQSLYSSVGFTLLAGYHYRSRQVPQS